MQPAPATRTPAQRIGSALLFAALALAGLWVLHDFLTALAWAVVFAIAAWPLYQRIAPLFPPRGRQVTAPLSATLLIGLVFVVPFSFVAVAVAHEVHVLLPLVAEARKNGIPAPASLGSLPLVGAPLRAWWRSNLSDPYTTEELLGQLDTHFIAVWTREIGAEVLHRATLFIFTLLALFFLFRDGASLSRKLLRLGDRLLGDRGERLALQMISAVHATLNGLVLVGLAEGLVIGIAYVAVGLPHAVSIMALTGVVAMIPFGAPVVFGGAALFLLAEDKLLGGIVVLGVGFAALFIADHFVRPVIIGGAARLPFLWVLLGILGGLESFGILGLFLGPVIMAALMSLWREETEAPLAAAAAQPRLARPAAAVERPGHEAPGSGI